MMHRVIGIGEILWDVFPDGPRFGGAPANFSCSTSELARNSVHVSIFSAVGDDDLGRQAIEALGTRGVDTSLIEVNNHSTGRVDIELDDTGVASYHFAEDSAWDHLQFDDAKRNAAAQCDAVCFGTLGQRSDASRTAIQAFVSATPPSCLRILDVNLRPPFVSDALIRTSLQIANVLKLNDDELPYLAKINEIGGSAIEVMRGLADRYQLRFVALTRGSKGAIILSNDNASDLAGRPVKVADTVGAGDAFTAAMTLGLLTGNDLDTVNRNAIEVASYVCSKQGATMSFPNHLQINPGLKS